MRRVTHRCWDPGITSEVCHFSVFKAFKFPEYTVHRGSISMINTNDVLRRHL